MDDLKNDDSLSSNDSSTDDSNHASSHHESHYPADSSFDKLSDIKPPEKPTDDDSRESDKLEDKPQKNDDQDDDRPSQPFFKHEAEPHVDQPAPAWQNQQPLSVTPVPSRSGLWGYKIGLLVLGLAVAGLVVFVVMQAGPAKQDKQTSDKANQVAEQLNSYIDKNSKIPESLNEAGINDAPSTISYKKESEESYKFCVTYQRAGSDYGSTVLEDTIYRGMTGVQTSTSGEDYYSGEQSYLYLNPEHDKGQNCQTIKPYVYGDPGSNDGSSIDYLDGSTADPKEEAKKAGAKTDACGVSGFATHYSGEVVSVTPSGADYVVKVKDVEGTVTGEQTFTISKANFNIYDRQCTASTAASLFAGDKIAVFAANSDKYAVNAIVNYYQ